MNSTERELAEVRRECRDPDWDGYDAEPVSRQSCVLALDLLRALPAELPSPSVGAMPGGLISLEWHQAARQTLTVVCEADGNLIYAGLFGPSTTSGIQGYNGTIPGVILAAIRRVYE